MDFTLPDEIIEVKETDPRDLLIVSVPKMGKTTIVAELTKKYNGIILNLDKSGTDYVSGRYVNIYNTPQTSFDEAMDNYKKWRETLLKNKGKYDFLIIDNLSDLDTMSEVLGTYYFMHSVPQGKNFNRDPKTGKAYKYGDEDFKLVTSMGEGYGYKYTRTWFLDQIAIFSEIAPYRIYLAHVKDKLIKNNQDEVISGLEINLTGKLKNIMSTKISSLSKLIADEDKRYLSFEVDNDNVIAGSRVPHLNGQILISEKDKEGNIITHWDKIYKNVG